MIQQINLYQDKLGSESQSDFNHYLLAVFASIFLLLALSGLNGYQISNQQAQHQILENQLLQSTTELLTLQSQLPNPQNDALIDQEIEKLQTLYQNLSHILELLANTQQDQSQGFSGYFSAMAEQADNSVWLSRIRINTSKKDISLDGSSFKPQSIPLLLQRLQNTAAFKGKNFARLSIQQSEKKPEQIDFSVSSSFNLNTETQDEKQP